MPLRENNEEIKCYLIVTFTSRPLPFECRICEPHKTRHHTNTELAYI